MSDILVQLDFFAANALNASPIFSLTDQDTAFESLTIDVQLRKMGGGSLVTHRSVGEMLGAAAALRPEVFVRVLIPSIDEEKYLWGFFLDTRIQKVVSSDEQGGKTYTIAGPGPWFYRSRAALFPVQYSVDGDHPYRIDVANGVFQFEGDADAGNVLKRLQREDDNNTYASFIPDLTYDFDHDEDSAGDPWDDPVGSDANPFTLPIGQSFMQDDFDVQAAVTGIDFTFDLGEVGDPQFLMSVWQSYGRNLTPSGVGDFSSGVVHFKEGVNFESELEVSGTSLRKATHVIVRGTDGAYAVAVRGSWSPGDYAKVAFLDYGHTSHLGALERRGLRWLRHQDDGENEFNFEHKPGFEPTVGLYMPGPDGTSGHYWIGDSVGTTTGTDDVTDLDYRADPQVVTGITMSVLPAVQTDTPLRAARSWKVKPQLNVDRASDNKTPSGGGKGEVGCQCIRLCIPGVITSETILYDLNWEWVSGDDPEYVDDYGGTPRQWPVGFPGNVAHTTGGGGNPGDATGDGTGYVWWGSVFSGGVSSPQLPPGVAGNVEHWSCYLRTTGDGVSVDVAWYDALDAEVDRQNIGSIGAGDETWHFVEADVTVPSGALYRQFEPSGPTPGLGNYGFYDKVVATIAANVSSRGDGNPALVGTGGRARRCDSTEHLLSDRDPLASDDDDLGYPVNTFWINTTTGRMWVLTDSTPGAAVWTPITLPAPLIEALLTAETNTALVLKPDGIGGVEWTTVGSSYTDEQAQDAVGGMIADTATVDLTYTDATPQLKADVIPAGIKLDDLGTPDDNTDLNATTGRHGLLPKLSGDAATFLNGAGAFTEPAGADPAEDVRAWMPLTTVVAGEPVLVWDDDDSLVPTLIPL